MMFGQQCSIGVIKHCFSAWTLKLKGGGAIYSMVPHFGGNTVNGVVTIVGPLLILSQNPMIPYRKEPIAMKQF